MIAEQIRELLEAEPFLPFEVYLADGKEITIDNPEYAMFSRTGQVLIVAVEGDRTVRVHLSMVTRVEGTYPEPA